MVFTVLNQLFKYNDAGYKRFVWLLVNFLQYVVNTSADDCVVLGKQSSNSMMNMWWGVIGHGMLVVLCGQFYALDTGHDLRSAKRLQSWKYIPETTRVL